MSEINVHLPAKDWKQVAEAVQHYAEMIEATEVDSGPEATHLRLIVGNIRQQTGETK